MDLPQWFFTVGFHEDLNQLLEVIEVFFVMRRSVVSEGTKVLFDLIAEADAVVFRQFWLEEGVLVH